MKEEKCVKSEEIICREYLFGLISRYSKTESGYRKKLYDKGFSTPSIKKAMELALEKGYINDKRFAEMYICSNEHKKGKMRLKTELLTKGVATELIEELLGEMDSQEDAAFVLGEKYLKNKEITYENLLKMQRHLAQKGFSYEEIRAVCYRMKADVDLTD